MYFDVAESVDTRVDRNFIKLKDKVIERQENSSLNDRQQMAPFS